MPRAEVTRIRTEFDVVVTYEGLPSFSIPSQVKLLEYKSIHRQCNNLVI